MNESFRVVMESGNLVTLFFVEAPNPSRAERLALEKLARRDPQLAATSRMKSIERTQAYSAA